MADRISVAFETKIRSRAVGVVLLWYWEIYRKGDLKPRLRGRKGYTSYEVTVGAGKRALERLIDGAAESAAAKGPSRRPRWQR